MRILTESFVEYAALTGQVTDEVVDKAVSSEMPAVVVDKIANEMLIACSRKAESVLETLDFSERIKVLTTIIAEENEIAVIEKELSQKVKESIDNNQKEYFLRERMKAIQEELGVNEDAGAGSGRVAETACRSSTWTAKIEGKIKKEIHKFSKMMPSSAEATVIRNYVETILALPWNHSSRVNVNLKKAEKILNEDHYGLDKVKERVLEYLAVVHLSKAIKGPILCLVGPPGVGKTSIARSIARASGREFVRMSLGGVRDEAEIRGHRRTYIGAIPGTSDLLHHATRAPTIRSSSLTRWTRSARISRAIRRRLCWRCWIRSRTIRLPITSWRYRLIFPRVMFITTANSTDTIPRPLLDQDGSRRGAGIYGRGKGKDRAAVSDSEEDKRARSEEREHPHFRKGAPGSDQLLHPGIRRAEPGDGRLPISAGKWRGRS